MKIAYPGLLRNLVHVHLEREMFDNSGSVLGPLGLVIGTMGIFQFLPSFPLGLVRSCLSLFAAEKRISSSLVCGRIAFIAVVQDTGPEYFAQRVPPGQG